MDLANCITTTPGVTPQSNAPSPDVDSTPMTYSTQISTPPPSNAFADNYDVDARLIDITSETWGALIYTPLRASPSRHTGDDISQTLATAYLIKRAGPRDENGLVRIALNFLHGHKFVVKEVLSMYGGLALLARVRGLIDATRGLVPLHVVAARKAHEVVNATMRYGDG